jgi:hypothetical protein
MGPSKTDARDGSALGRGRPQWRISAIALSAACAGLLFTSVAAFEASAAGAAPQTTDAPGFSQPFAGSPAYQSVAPTEATSPSQINQPIGQTLADQIAIAIGLNKDDVFTQQQYEEFITGGGFLGSKSAAELADASVRILTNTVGRPLVYTDANGHLIPSVLASYGLFVNSEGLLESPAQDSAPTREINDLLAPKGYLTKWCIANGATAALSTLYKSAYFVEAAYGFVAQHLTEPAELAPNLSGGVLTSTGMSMAPTIWVVNFALIYTLNPELAALMPAYWAPIPRVVANALRASSTGQVPYAKFAALFN